MSLLHLSHRTLAKLTGPDRFDFLQGLVTCNVMQLKEKKAIYGAFLTPQGKFLDDLFLVADDDSLYLDSHAETAPALYQKLTMYKLRSDVTLTPLPEAKIYASFSSSTDGVCYQDPRHADLGYRIIAKEGLLNSTSDLSAYDARRYELGIADGARDMPVQKAVLLEYGFDEMGAIDFEKGCYLGQELTARTKYRGIVRKRLLPFTYEGKQPESAADISFQDKKAGEVRAASHGKGLALIRLEALSLFFKTQEKFIVGDTQLTPFTPSWMKIDLPDDA